MFFTVYKITNKINGKYYIGKHQTTNLDDGYMGSGKFIKAALKKHGVENFSKEILHVFETEVEMNLKEAELVIVSDLTYNLCDGGHGGFSHVRRDRSLHTTYAKRGRANANKALQLKYGNDWQSILQSKSRDARRIKLQSDPSYRDELYSRLDRMRVLGREIGCKASQTPKANAKRRNTFAAIGHQQGAKNSSYGTIWITDGALNKKIKSVDPIPEGWYKGRRISVSGVSG